MNQKQQIVELISSKPGISAPEVVKSVGCSVNYVYKTAKEFDLDLGSADGDESTAGVACPACGHAVSRVLDSRPTNHMNRTTTRRRRLCAECNERWTTFEVGEQVFEDLKGQIRNEVVRSILGHFKLSQNDLLDLMIDARDQERQS